MPGPFDVPDSGTEEEDNTLVVAKTATKRAIPPKAALGSKRVREAPNAVTGTTPSWASGGSKHRQLTRRILEGQNSVYPADGPSSQRQDLPTSLSMQGSQLLCSNNKPRLIIELLYNLQSTLN